MINPMLSLSMSLDANKGIYALLLGSGISSSASIPTGWAIVKDLIRQIAKLEGEDFGNDAETWYINKFGTEPNYSELLNEVAKSPTERRNLLNGYFEPTEEERKANLKTPTKAHRAIASLVLSGHIKVIITTNFDSLIETALNEVGISPIIISTSDSIQGALPIVHSTCTVIKLHGDYRDIRIKNTIDELKAYDESLNIMLDRIFDEFGLIVCGWSADWDFALVNAIERCKSRRFTTYWATRSEPSKNAKHLIDFRQAEIIRIKDADSFFDELQERVQILEELKSPHPLSTKTALAALKRYLPDPSHKIRLHDLVMNETENVCNQINDRHFPLNVTPNDGEFLKRIKDYECVTETLRALFATGCYWSDDSQVYLWIKSLNRIANVSNDHFGLETWLKLSLYPALLIMYAGGIAFVAREKYSLLQDILVKSTLMQSGYEKAMLLSINAMKVLPESIGKRLPGITNHYTPGSDYLYYLLRPNFQELIPNDYEYEKAFDKFEYLLALLYLNLTEPSNPPQKEYVWAPYGCYAWKRLGGNNTIEEIKNEAKTMGNEWPVIKQGLFGGSISRYEHLETVHTNFLKNLNF